MSVYSLLVLGSPLLLLRLAACTRHQRSVIGLDPAASSTEVLAAITAGQTGNFKAGTEVQMREGIPPWLQRFVGNGFLYITKVLGDLYTPKTLINKGKDMIRIDEEVNVTFSAGSEMGPETCTLLDRAGQTDGNGETMVQFWKCRSFDYIILAAQRASGSKKYLFMSNLEAVNWPAHWDNLPAGFQTKFRVRQYESYKVQKLWSIHGLEAKLTRVMDMYPNHTLFFTGASRGATLAEVMGLRFALEFRKRPNYRMPYVVSTGAYRWTNSIGRDIFGYLLPQHFAHILLSRTKVKGEMTFVEFDFVSRWPGRASGYVDVAPQFALDVDKHEMQTCVPRLGCPGTDVSISEGLHVFNMLDRFKGLHKSINFIRTLRKAVIPFDDVVCLDWKQESCDSCLGVPISNLMTASDRQIGRIGCLDANDGLPIPECPVENSAVNQAGGHAGDFQKLRDGKIAKRSRALDVLSSQKSRAALNEWIFYMQTWCINRLAGQEGRQEHLLDPFALGPNPWAPRFYGLCQISASTGDSQKYLVMEDLHSRYHLASVLDIKLGQTIEFGSSDSTAKKLFQSAVSRVTSTHTAGARLAGLRVWNPKKNRWKTSTNVMSSIDSVFDKAFKYLLRQSGEQKRLWLTQFHNTTQKLDQWWKSKGVNNVRSYAASLLFVWEGDPAVAEPKAPVLKFIDFAHFHSQGRGEWPDDGTSRGLSTVVAQLERLIRLTYPA
mmetsp:Transcript_135849/g.270993  ORF Transcript_135849/g.270993 Transcript_135849/m.270993 type:complete len:718 (-) Transcript_135849:40-2193(-)